MRRIKICTTYTRTTSLGARASCFIVTTRKIRPSYDLPSTQIPSHASLSSASTPMHFIYGQSCRTCRLDISFSEKKKQASGGKRPEGMSMAINWLEWEALQSRQPIRHQGNDSEKLIGMKRLPVDDFAETPTPSTNSRDVYGMVIDAG